MPFVEGALGVPADPSAWYVPSVEGPTMDAGPHLPDLVPLPAWGVFVGRSIVAVTVPEFVQATAAGEDPYADSRKALRFGTTIANRGRHSLELVGVPSEGGPDGSAELEARQCVRFAGPRLADAERMCTEHRPVGSLRFDGEDGRLHADGFTQYRLLRDAGGRPDERSAAVVARAQRAGFCVGDMAWLGKGHMLADSGWYRDCRPPVRAASGSRHGLSPHWGDVVDPGAEGQYFPLDGVADGDYWIAITVNAPEASGGITVLEANRANNTSYRKVRLSKGGTHASAL